MKPPGSDKGQSAMEFLMTYGWAILLLLVVMVVMWQWGLLSFGGQIRPGSFGFWGIVPTVSDFKLNANGVLELPLTNNVDTTITINRVNVTMGSDIWQVTPLISLDPGRTQIVTINLPAWARGNVGDRYDLYITINYTNPDIGHFYPLSSGVIWGSYER